MKPCTLIPALVLLAGCTIYEPSEPESSNVSIPVEKLDDYTDYTAICGTYGSEILPEGVIIWKENDIVSIFPKKLSHWKYGFETITEDNSGTEAVFEYKETVGEENADTLDYYYAVYPFFPETQISKKGIITTRINTVQKHNPDNIFQNATMVAVAHNDTLRFQPSSSLLLVNLSKSGSCRQTCTIEQVKLESKYRALSGSVRIDTRFRPYSSETVSTTNYAVMDTKSEVTEEVRTFCLTIPPNTYLADELICTFTYSSGNENGTQYFSVRKSFDSDIVLEPGDVISVEHILESVPENDLAITTGDIFEYNGYRHTAPYNVTLEKPVSDGAAETGILYQFGGSDKLRVEYADSDENVKRFICDASTTGNTVSLNGLEENSEYSYRYYAISENGGITYGDIKNFKTDYLDNYAVIEPGTFTMGANSGTFGYDAGFKTAPAHKVTISKEYEICRYEVTTDQFVLFLNSTGAEKSGNNVFLKDDRNKLIHSISTKEPMVTYANGEWLADTDRGRYVMGKVTKYGAEAYCKWLTETKNDGYIYRLPTEAEWEFAASGGTKSRRYKFIGGDDYKDVVVYKWTMNGYSSTAYPGTKYPNELGIYDMGGNAWEWVSDYSDRDHTVGYFQYCVNTYEDNTVDPEGYTDITTHSIVKGGSANESPDNPAHTSKYRRTDRPLNYIHSNGGFRVVRVKN